ncbi:YtxH domain-containing protein [Streptococcus suis]|uniref:CD3337/EF1877 family mobilome membrane protein n=1 Tax=Streptococcus parasuis TaxID=1501662 RepID=UPI0015524137|nr:YtxH domain-containing protein [Streptococcus suis]WNF85580.1 YtxH domain-containing protein [Streptococcus parasuis]
MKQERNLTNILRKIGKVILTAGAILIIILLFLSMVGTVAHAAGLVDDTVNAANEYSKYPLENYQLDFYVDNSWDWLPWNWIDGIGKQVMYGLYAITNFIWTISLYISNATGYLVKEAYSLDFISSTANAIGKNMQTLAGVTSSGLSSEGFYVGFLLIFILILGIYVSYTGLIKRETTKAVHAIVNFVLVFILSASFIAYAPDYITKINDFSSDISNASLSLGTKITLPDSEAKGKDSVDLIRDSLFSIQVKQPWLLLQYGTTDIDSLGADRVENLLSTSPDSNNGEDRENIIIEEIEDKDNANMTITKTINRLGTVFFLFLFNIGISIFVFLLTGIMIFSQILFIIYAMFLPVSFLLSMIPTFDCMSKRAITKLFNTILTRAGITLIITVAFSISTMLYSLSAGYPFFMVAFLQIVTFAGVYFKLGDLMSLFSLQSNDSQGVGSRMMRKPRMLMHAQMHHLQRTLGRSMTVYGVGSAVAGNRNQERGSLKHSPQSQADHSRPQSGKTASLGAKLGQGFGTIADTKDTIAASVNQFREQVTDLPTNARYAVFQGKNKIRENLNDFTGGITQARTDRADRRNQEQEARRQTIAERRLRMEMAKSEKSPASPVHERPTIKQKQTVQGQEPQKTIREFQSANIQERPVPRADRFKENSSPLRVTRQAPVNQRTQSVNLKSRPLQTARIKKDQGKPS